MLSRAKAIDLIWASPAIAYGCWVIWTIAAAALHGDAPAIVLASLVASLVLAALSVGVTIVRLPPKKIVRGLMPRYAAIAGSISPMVLAELPFGDVGFPILIAGLSLILAGTAGAIWAVAFLGRSYAIMPEARRLVTHGPYRFLRHPLYFFEMLAVFGVVIQRVQPWAALVFLAEITLILVRIGYEERALSDAFPNYAAYAANRPRIVPGIY